MRIYLFLILLIFLKCYFSIEIDKKYVIGSDSITTNIYKSNSKLTYMVSKEDGTFYLMDTELDTLNQFNFNTNLNVRAGGYRGKAGFLDMVDGNFYLAINDPEFLVLLKLSFLNTNKFKIEDKRIFSGEYVSSIDSVYVNSDDKVLTLVTNERIYKISTIDFTNKEKSGIPQSCWKQTGLLISNDHVYIGCQNILLKYIVAPELLLDKTYSYIDYGDGEISSLALIPHTNSITFSFIPEDASGTTIFARLSAGDLEELEEIELSHNLVPSGAVGNSKDHVLYLYQGEVLLIKGVQEKDSNSTKFEVESRKDFKDFIATGAIYKEPYVLVSTDSSSILRIPISKKEVKDDTYDNPDPIANLVDKKHHGMKWWQITMLVIGITVCVALTVVVIKFYQDMKKKKHLENYVL
ncbi:hypothetical protein DLAC_10912 [Tieghemostelium lacteum]|uniref:Uncharacterized protein n=1 Tax=Tieghemostelium lacteum TaxID=361077 RepID=A0A151Z2S4_TIELA|nr:hypothetical protein DLAC_10912 [Tieghemostelium lacteum]|eukprot:KYQ88227.1 hypothetical protein DLAC_10912 [Tieghemostelium lacteum]